VKGIEGGLKQHGRHGEEGYDNKKVTERMIIAENNTFG
jgi:hypothetical protein